MVSYYERVYLIGGAQANQKPLTEEGSQDVPYLARGQGEALTCVIVHGCGHQHACRLRPDAWFRLSRRTALFLALTTPFGALALREPRTPGDHVTGLVTWCPHMEGGVDIPFEVGRDSHRPADVPNTYKVSSYVG